MTEAHHLLPFSLLASSNNTSAYFRFQGERFRVKARLPDLLSSRQKTQRKLCKLLGSLDTLAPLTLDVQQHACAEGPPTLMALATIRSRCDGSHIHTCTLSLQVSRAVLRVHLRWPSQEHFLSVTKVSPSESTQPPACSPPPHVCRTCSHTQEFLPS